MVGSQVRAPQLAAAPGRAASDRPGAAGAESPVPAAGGPAGGALKDAVGRLPWWVTVPLKKGGDEIS